MRRFFVSCIGIVRIVFISIDESFAGAGGSFWASVEVGVAPSRSWDVFMSCGCICMKIGFMDVVLANGESGEVQVQNVILHDK